MIKDAILSPDKKYRYLLTRDWHPSTRDYATPLMFIMLNPSTADTNVDDPTIRKCIGFADRLGFDAIGVLNLFAIRSVKPSPASQWTRLDVGKQEIGTWIKSLGTSTPTVVAAWGAGAPEWRVKEVLDEIAGEPLYCLGTTAAGAPRHPLYVPYTQGIERWKP